MLDGDSWVLKNTDMAPKNQAYFAEASSAWVTKYRWYYIIEKFQNFLLTTCSNSNLLIVELDTSEHIGFHSKRSTKEKIFNMRK